MKTRPGPPAGDRLRCGSLRSPQLRLTPAGGPGGRARRALEGGVGGPNSTGVQSVK